jgi:hypothetical protein
MKPWRLSAKGNQRKKLRGYWITILKKEDGFHFTVGGSTVFFSEPHKTESSAKLASLHYFSSILDGTVPLAPMASRPRVSFYGASDLPFPDVIHREPDWDHEMEMEEYRALQEDPT